MTCLLNKLYIKKVLLYFFIQYILLLVYHTAYAANPYLTEDPVPIDYKHWEVFIFSVINKNNVVNLEPDLLGPALEINWGAAPDLELHVMIPYAWALPDLIPAANGHWRY